MYRFLLIFILAMAAIVCLGVNVSSNIWMNSPEIENLSFLKTKSQTPQPRTPVLQSEINCPDVFDTDQSGQIRQNFIAQAYGTTCLTPYGQCPVTVAAPIGSPCCCPNIGCGYIGQ